MPKTMNATPMRHQTIVDNRSNQKLIGSGVYSKLGSFFRQRSIDWTHLMTTGRMKSQWPRPIESISTPPIIPGNGYGFGTEQVSGVVASTRQK